MSKKVFVKSSLCLLLSLNITAGACGCAHKPVEREETETVILDRKDLYGVGDKSYVNSIAPEALKAIEEYVEAFNRYAPADIQIDDYAVIPCNGGYAITAANGIQGLVRVNEKGNILLLTPLSGTSHQKIQVSLVSMDELIERGYFPEDKQLLKDAIHENCKTISSEFSEAKSKLEGSGLNTSLPDVSDQMKEDEKALEELIEKCDKFLAENFPELLEP